MNSMRIVVSSTAHDIAKALPRLRALGMKVDSVLDAIGVATGEIDEAKFAELEQVPGIKVEREGKVQIAPPDAELQ